MTASLKITSNNLIALTSTELDALRAILKTGDRAGFYLTYYAMTGSQEAELQARIATFSGPVGSVAFGANRLLQEAFGPGSGESPQYAGMYFLSQQVAQYGLDAIVKSAESHPSGGKVEDGPFFDTATAAWEEASNEPYFPGRLFEPDRAAPAFTSFLASLANYENWDSDLVLNLIRANSEPGALAAALAMWVAPDFGKSADEGSDPSADKWQL